MNRLATARWGRARPQPRRIMSLDSLLMNDQVNSTASEDPEALQMQDNTMVAQTSCDRYSNNGHGATKPHGQDDESERKKIQDGSFPSQALPGTKKTTFDGPRDWASEIAALVLAFCCLVAIFVILAKFHNQQQPNWSRASTLNLSSLIALIATVLRSMLEVVLNSGIGQLKWHWFRTKSQPLIHIQTFEDASRGAWGSLVFIFSLARFNLATLGSIITILSVVIGTFTQQAIQTVPCQRSSSNGTASIPIAQTALVGLQKSSDSDPIYSMAKEFKASVIAGLAGVRQPNSFSPACSTGNCEFQATNGVSYSTTELSSECIDVSSLISQTGSGIDNWVSNGHNYSSRAITNYTLPNGLNISYQLALGAYAIGTIGGRWSTMLAQAQMETRFDDGSWSALRNVTMTPRQREIVFDSPSFDGILLLMPTTNPCQEPSDYYTYFEDQEQNPMPAIKVNSCPELNLPGVDTLPGYFSVTAAACFFYASLQQYESSFEGGILEEKAVQDPSPISIADYKGDNTSNAASCWRCKFADPCVIDHVVYTSTSTNLSSVPGGAAVLGNITGPSRCIYGFSYPWYRALMVQSELWDTIGSSDDENTCDQTGNYTSMICSKTWWFNDIFNGGNASAASINEYVKRGFDSISGQLRSVGTDWDGNPSVAYGTAYDTVVCVQFHWQWLFYPLALALGVLVLLLLLMVTRSGTGGSRKEVIWKSSVLPLLFYGLEGQIRDQSPKLAREEELRGVAKKTKTYFNSGYDGWRLYP